MNIEKMMDIMVIAIVVPAIAVLMIRLVLIFAKRPQRRAELKRHVEAIMQKNGCHDAPTRYHECAHIVKHYGISLSEVGFDGDLGHLGARACESANRYYAHIGRPLDKPLSRARCSGAPGQVSHE